MTGVVPEPVRAPAPEPPAHCGEGDAAVALDERAADERRAAGLPVVTRAEFDASRASVDDLPWPGAFNARDLGGIPVDGGVVRRGVLFRSGQPEAWTPAGWREAAAGGVRRVLDLRDPREPRSRPDGAEAVGIAVAHCAVDDPDDAAFRERFVPYLDHTAGDRDFVGMFGDRVAAAVGRVVADGPGTVVCCSAGRDRTGLVTGMLLRALGAPIAALQDADERAVRSVNHRHLVRTTRHPYEAYRTGAELAATISSRREAIADFFEGLDAGGWLRERGVDVDAARAWLVDPEGGAAGDA